MNDTTLIKTGAIGAVTAAVCCGTPVLVIVLGALGLSALTGYIDYVLLPIFALCIGMIGYGLYRRRQAATCCADESSKSITRGS